MINFSSICSSDAHTGVLKKKNIYIKCVLCTRTHTLKRPSVALASFHTSRPLRSVEGAAAAVAARTSSGPQMTALVRVPPGQGRRVSRQLAKRYEFPQSVKSLALAVPPSLPLSTLPPSLFPYFPNPSSYYDPPPPYVPPYPYPYLQKRSF